MATKPTPGKVGTKSDLGVPIAKGKIIIANDPKKTALPTAKKK